MLAMKFFAKAMASASLPGTVGLPCLKELAEGCKTRSGYGIPNEQAIQVEVGPFLGLPPVVGFAIGRVVPHGVGRGSLCDGLEKDGAPGDVGFGNTKSGSEFELN